MIRRVTSFIRVDKPCSHPVQSSLSRFLSLVYFVPLRSEASLTSERPRSMLGSLMQSDALSFLHALSLLWLEQNTGIYCDDALNYTRSVRDKERKGEAERAFLSPFRILSRLLEKARDQAQWREAGDNWRKSRVRDAALQSKNWRWGKEEDIEWEGSGVAVVLTYFDIEKMNKFFITTRKYSQAWLPIWLID